MVSSGTNQHYTFHPQKFNSNLPQTKGPRLLTTGVDYDTSWWW